MKPSFAPLLIRLKTVLAVNGCVLIGLAVGVLPCHSVRADDNDAPAPERTSQDAPSPTPDDASAAANPESSPTPQESPQEAVEVPMTTDTAPTPEALPDIDALTLTLRPLKASTSKRVYLFDDLTPTPSQPQDSEQASADTAAPAPIESLPRRKLLMLKKGDDNVMGLRVLKVIPEKKEVIAKQIMQYPPYAELTIGEPYFAVEKISDHAAAPLTKSEKEDIAEVESTPLAYDPELDAGSSPDPNAANNADSDDENAKLGGSIEEKNVKFEKQTNWLSLGLGLLSNNPGFGYSLYTGGGIRYGLTLWDNIFTKSGGENMDSLQMELGLYYYKIAGLDLASDSYSIVPVIFTGRYTYFLTEDFALFGYLGVLYNAVISSTNSQPSRVTNMEQATTAVGGGMLYRIGPQWYGRLDAGLDMIGLSLMLRF